MVHLLREWVVDDPDLGVLVNREAQGNGDVGVGVDEIGGAIDGIDDEDGPRGNSAGRWSCLFSQESGQPCQPGLLH